jgi:hypothetical protein
VKERLSRREACVRGAGEIALAITMATLTTIVVFVPVALVEGEGQFFLMRLALPISVSLLASLLVALVFIPLERVPDPAGQRTGWTGALSPVARPVECVLRRVYDRTFERLNRLYNRLAGGVASQHRLDLGPGLAAVFAVTHFVVSACQDRLSSSRRRIAPVSPSPSRWPTNTASRIWWRAISPRSRSLLAERQEEYGLRGYFTFHRTRTGGSIEGWFDDRPRTSTALGQRWPSDCSRHCPSKPGIKVFYGRDNQNEEARGQEQFSMHLEGDDPLVLDQIARQSAAPASGGPGGNCHPPGRGSCARARWRS